MYLKGEEPFIISRSEGYIGVLIDDLVTKGVTEPYRLLTSRAEYRLMLRQDNADLRLTERGYRIGLVTPERYKRFISKRKAIEAEIERLQSTMVVVSPEMNEILKTKGSSPVQGSTTLANLLKRPEIEYGDLLKLPLEHPQLDEEVMEEVEILVKYEGYIKKQESQIKKFEKMEGMKIPPDIDYKKVRGLAVEAMQKLEKIRPVSIGQASRISGVNPADISVLLVYLEKNRRNIAGGDTG
jgi:tRNA uridine 5-carboxymethylaminomethyl modification enzyme